MHLMILTDNPFTHQKVTAKLRSAHGIGILHAESIERAKYLLNTYSKTLRQIDAVIIDWDSNISKNTDFIEETLAVDTHVKIFIFSQFVNGLQRLNKEFDQERVFKFSDANFHSIFQSEPD